MNLWSAMGLHGLSLGDIASLAFHYLLLSLVSIGGTLGTASDMQHFLVVSHGWIDDRLFTASIAIAQAAPGPNVLFVALLGWNVAGLLGMATTIVSIMLPSSLLAIGVGRFRTKRADSPLIRAFTAGLAPLVIGLLLSTGWILIGPAHGDWRAWVLTGLTVLALLRTKLGPLPLIALGALAGVLGLV